jgi:DUF971 family protein
VKAFAFLQNYCVLKALRQTYRGTALTKKKIISGRRHIGIMDITPVGNYAICIKFDDLHDTGIYTWDLLHDFGINQVEIWQNYQSALECKNLSRDP